MFRCATGFDELCRRTMMVKLWSAQVMWSDLPAGQRRKVMVHFAPLSGVTSPIFRNSVEVDGVQNDFEYLGHSDPECHRLVFARRSTFDLPQRHRDRRCLWRSG